MMHDFASPCASAFFAQLTAWARAQPDIEAVLLVGSWARGAQRPDSDIDIMLLTRAHTALAGAPQFAAAFDTLGPLRETRTEFWGACTSIRAFYAGGAEVEYGLVTPEWLARPLDAGTRRVLSGGWRVLLDKTGLCAGEDLPPQSPKGGNPC